jgi:hypothetical protein
VELLIDPGLPMESVKITCPDEPAITLPDVLWRNSWDYVHPADNTGFNFLTKWEMPPSHDPFAQLKSLEIVANNMASVIETTTIKLTPPPGN